MLTNVKFKGGRGFYGSGIYVKLIDGGKFIVDSCFFSGSSTYRLGGAIYAELESEGNIFEVKGETIIQNYFVYAYDGIFMGGNGILFDVVGQGSEILIEGDILFYNLRSTWSGDQGGALYFSALFGQTILISKTTFQICSSSLGGAIIAVVEQEGEYMTFEDCSGIDEGGGFYCSSQGQVYLNKMTFNNCSCRTGGGMWISYKATLQGEVTFSDCSTTQIDGSGGGISIICNNDITITGKMTFLRCQSVNRGGGLYILYINGVIANSNSMTFKNCTALSKGGGAYILTQHYEWLKLNQLLFDECKSQYGGGIYADID
ncbi:MAG: hypothetical protein EZS28_026278 [Streblomastix strix]|uniref:Right handed beta helix domain-containing protein n=1 Tax=Streblomastix strix TaxID=222440 RepID=A0A5J4V7P9_9EUKA|nr:MAG: hypothetical protein EZS28_026278 [Streblomastix strix]